jgi:YVTN family beta-propeller protein
MAVRSAAPGRPVGPLPGPIAITPEGTTAYVASTSYRTVTPIDTATNTALPAIRVGQAPDAIAITP